MEKEPDRVVSSLTTIRPPPVKCVNLLRPVVVRDTSVGSLSATVESKSMAFSFSAVFVSSAGAPSMRTRHPTPIEAQPSRRKGRASETLAA